VRVVSGVFGDFRAFFEGGFTKRDVSLMVFCGEFVVFAWWIVVSLMVVFGREKNVTF
jgi:hypothetical protein